MYLIAFLWSGSIIVSRMYLGVHSPADITGGTLIGAIILRVFLSTCDWIDDWMIYGRMVPLYMLIVSTFLLTLHPKTNPPSYTYAETTSLLGWITGSVAGIWMNPVDRRSPLFVGGLPSFTSSGLLSIALILVQELWKPVLRYILGLVVMVTGYVLGKKILSAVIGCLGLLKNNNSRGSSCSSNGNMETGSDLTVPETVVKFGTYLAMGLGCTMFAPLLFDLLHLW